MHFSNEQPVSTKITAILIKMPQFFKRFAKLTVSPKRNGYKKQL
jgi:hypothetical protein